MMAILEKRKILPTITTTRGSDWRKKIEEVNKLGLKEIALFPTCLKKEERKDLYKLIEQSCIEEIPMVHLRNDFDGGEIKYFIKNYNTKVFCLHTNREFLIPENFFPHKKNIYIENVYKPLDENEIKNFGGICLDLAHLENDRLLNKDKFKHNIKIIERNEIGCNHISCVKNNKHMDENNQVRYDYHSFDKLSEFDYLKKYPKEYFSSYIAIELEDNINKQLEAIEYIKNLLKPDKDEIPDEYKKGYANFLNCRIDLSKKPFIPRIETEFWVGKAIEEIRQSTRNKRQTTKILDLFSGSGCIGIAVLKNIPDAVCDFGEKNEEFLKQIEINLELNKIEKGRAKIIKTDVFSKIEGKYDYIFANPPYVAKSKIKKVQASVLDYEPHEALFAGDDGLSYIRNFLKEARGFLEKGGIIYMEFGLGQSEKIRQILEKEKYKLFRDQFKKYRWVRIEN